MKVQVVTTFSPEGYRVYGKRCIESFLAYDKDSEMVAYYEGQKPDLIHPRAIFRSLDEDQDRSQFIALHGNDPKKVGTPADFNGQSIKFCHKVFAISHAICTAAVSAHQPDWVVWLDADVVTHARPNWSEILPPSADLVYLGRDPEKHPHWKMLGRYRPICSETGFVGYRITPQVVAMADAMRMFYMTGELYTRPSTDWHDAKVFDLCRERSAVPKDRWLNLSHEVPQTDVWPLVPVLARWSSHHKGPRRKVAAYGSNA